MRVGLCAPPTEALVGSGKFTGAEIVRLIGTACPVGAGALAAAEDGGKKSWNADGAMSFRTAEDVGEGCVTDTIGCFLPCPPEVDPLESQVTEKLEVVGEPDESVRPEAKAFRAPVFVTMAI